MEIDFDKIADANLGTLPRTLQFGVEFADYMFTQEYEADKGWSNARIGMLENFSLHPAAAVLHYGQEIFEGLKAYRARDGRVLLFRPDQNVARFNRSAERMSMPQVVSSDHMQAIHELVRVNERWVPHERGASLYIRPAMMATSPKLGLGSARNYTHFIIASPVGAYFKSDLEPVSVYVSDVCRRAVVGGVGEAKTGGNYAASLMVSEKAAKGGYSQVLWLDAVEGRFVEEVGAMNICFVHKDGTVVTPELSGSILAGITRDSVLKLAPTMGYPVAEARLDIAEIIIKIESGEITEAFGCGTAAVISPVNMFSYKERRIKVGDGTTGPVSKAIFNRLSAIQYGDEEAPFDWVTSVT